MAEIIRIIREFKNRTRFTYTCPCGGKTIFSTADKKVAGALDALIRDFHATCPPEAT